MGAGYVRQSAAQIAAGQPVAPTPVNNEFNQLQSAFSGTTGHVHDGSTGNGPPLAAASINGLTALSTGLVIVNGSGAFLTATITGTSNRLTVTNGTGVSGNPTLDISASYVGQASITTLGTIATGVWNGTIISPVYGGTGVNNSTNTITLGGNVTTASSFTTSGASPLILTVSGSTNVTLPLSGTLVNTAVTTLGSLVSIGTITSGTWSSSATKIGLASGGTNADLSATGGTHFVLKQNSVGAAITAAQLSTADLSDGVSGTGVIILASNATLTNPTFTTPTLGAATATTLNKVTITQPASAATLTIVNNKTLTASNTLTLAGTDSTTITFQATDTYVGRATTDTLTNKTYDTAGTGNAFKINGTAITAVTGTGSVVLSAAPTLTGTTTIAVAAVTTFSGTPNFSGAATGTTAASNDSSTKLATTAFVNPGNSIGANGYRRNSDGTYEQWGTTVSITSGGSAVVTFPTAFPNACFSVVATSNATDGSAVSNNYLDTIGTSSFTMHNKQSTNATFTWMAIGN